MQGDIININDDHRRTASEIIQPFLNEIKGNKQVYIISVAGESGAGKSTIAFAIADQLEQLGFPVKIFQQDDYFFLPPHTNDQKRRSNLSWVGTNEVNLKLLDKHLQQAKKGMTKINKPLVIYKENKITTELFEMSGVQVCVVEGTYTSLLENVDKRVFIDRYYSETFGDRKKRARDTMDSFNEKVLEIEHNIIVQHKLMADIILDKDFKVHFVK